MPRLAPSGTGGQLHSGSHPRPSDGPARGETRPAEPRMPSPHPWPWSASLPTPWRRVTEPALLEAAGQAQAGLDPLWPQPAHPNTCSELQTLIAPQSAGRDAPRPRDAPLCSGAEREHAVGGAGLGAEPAHHVSSSPVAPPRGADRSRVGGGRRAPPSDVGRVHSYRSDGPDSPKAPSSQAGSHSGKGCVTVSCQPDKPLHRVEEEGSRRCRKALNQNLRFLTAPPPRDLKTPRNPTLYVATLLRPSRPALKYEN